jgi:hypothetical protein
MDAPPPELDEDAPLEEEEDFPPELDDEDPPLELEEEADLPPELDEAVAPEDDPELAPEDELAAPALLGEPELLLLVAPLPPDPLPEDPEGAPAPEDDPPPSPSAPGLVVSWVHDATMKTATANDEHVERRCMGASRSGPREQ